MTCRLWRYGRSQNRKQNSNMGDVWANSVAYMSYQSHVPRCKVLPPREFNVMIPEPQWNRSSLYFFCFPNAFESSASGGFRIVSDTLVNTGIRCKRWYPIMTKYSIKNMVLPNSPSFEDCALPGAAHAVSLMSLCVTHTVFGINCPSYAASFSLITSQRRRVLSS